MCVKHFFKLKFFKSYYTKTQITEINNHLPCHLSQPTRLGAYPKTTTGTNREPTIYNHERSSIVNRNILQGKQRYNKM